MKYDPERKPFSLYLKIKKPGEVSQSFSFPAVILFAPLISHTQTLKWKKDERQYSCNGRVQKWGHGKLRRMLSVDFVRREKNSRRFPCEISHGDHLGKKAVKPEEFRHYKAGSNVTSVLRLGEKGEKPSLGKRK